ncbi:MAG: hypothetical protein HRT82_05045 [Henriciella sp.]|nr:hypothetical protein [Henriciella sp.]
MKKMITAAIAAGFVAAPAFAASITVSFANDDGTTAEWTFDGEGTATSGDVSTSYTWDEEAMKLCADVPEQGEICATFDAVADEVGETAGYTLSNGGSGTATITAMSE